MATPMKIDLELTITEARKVAAALATSTDKDVAGIHQELVRWLGVYDARDVAPWRKVVSFDSRAGLRGIETLECGHTRSLRFSKNWTEERGERRRCEQCARKQNQEAA